MINYDEGEWGIHFLLHWNGSLLPKALVCAITSVLFGVGVSLAEEWYPRNSFHPGGGNQIFSGCTLSLVLLLAFRTEQALGRFWEGTGLLHQMRGEWFDATSCLFAFSRKARETRPDAVDDFRHTLIRLTSLLHGCALREIGGESSTCIEVIDFAGLDDATLAYLHSSKEDGFDTVEVLLHMIQVLIVKNHREKVLMIAPPILTRVYQELSRGLVNLHNAKKIADIQFPFPYAQLISVLLIVHSILVPLFFWHWVDNKWLASLFVFVAVVCPFCLNFIASQLEMPFGADDNDLPIHLFQSEMNRSLLLLLHKSSDVCPTTSAGFDLSKGITADGAPEKSCTMEAHDTFRVVPPDKLSDLALFQDWTFEREISVYSTVYPSDPS